MNAFFSLEGKMRLGVSIMDEEHDQLADLLNRLAVAVAELPDSVYRPPSADADPGVAGPGTAGGGRPDQCQVIDELLDRLVVRTQEHFRNEEGLMRSVDYPALAGHGQEHRLLFAELKSYVRSIKDGKECLRKSDLASLKSWLVGHITAEDRLFAEYLLRCERR